MKHTSLALATTLTACASAHAATIVNADPGAEGIGYAWTVQIGENESIVTPNEADANVGVWSWNDTAFAGAPDMGWTHTSSWVALEVTTPMILHVTMGRNASVPAPSGFFDTQYLFPSMTLWAGQDNTGSDNHIYANNGLVDWAEGLTALLGRVDNNSATSATLKVYLEPGLYTLALGGQGPAVGGLPRQGYFASFTAIPEPSSAVLAGAAAGLLALRRRRR